jgi:hypothetical protein
MVHAGKSRYGHAFSKGKNGVAPRSRTTLRVSPSQRLALTAVPHPEHRPAARVSPDLAPVRVREAIEGDLRIRISCDNCQHETVWTRGYMERKLKRLRDVTLLRLASQLRCGGCRSDYIRVWKG